MPELPEVETICRGLRHGGSGHGSILNKKIIGVLVLWSRSIQTPEVESFKTHVVGNKIVDITRRGKFIIFELKENYLLFHLRMSGDLFIRNGALAPEIHDRLIFSLDDGSDLVFNDARKFGRAWLVKDPQEVVGSLGLDPFDSLLDQREFYSMLQTSSRKLKPLLTDQKFLAGLGNIYTDEALFLASLHPELPANQVTLEESGKLLEGIRLVLTEGIRHHGASIDWVYRGGDFQNLFRVYRQTGKACQRCGTEIERIVVNQRGTHFCPNCQKKSI